MEDYLLERRENENFNSYEKRLVYGKLKDKTLVEYDFQEIYKALYDIDISSTEARKRIYGLKDHFEAVESETVENITDNSILDEIDMKLLEIQKENKKKQTINLEINKNLRLISRGEMTQDAIIEAIKNLTPFEVVSSLNINNNHKEGILPITDTHFGKQTLVKGLRGEILNEYNEEIFQARMEKLLNEVISICEKENITKLNITLQGDLIDGILRMSQLNKLQYGIIDSVMRFSEYIATWFNELSKYVNCEIYSCLGNHSEIRPLGSKNGEFKEENMEKIIIWFLQNRLENNENIIINNIEGDFIFFNCLGLNIMGSHGQERNLEIAIKDYESLYNVNIDMFLGGHLHSKDTKSIGINHNGLSDKEYIRIKSICGIDDFSMKLRKASSPGSTLLVLEEGKGKTIEYDIKL